MEVRCSNCATEYEFDDALVSARGTSVKCTNCGHQFRVHPTSASPTLAEKWVVRDAQKRETVFTSLRDLQQAIVKGQLSPQHQLSHGGQAFRPLEDIYELQTFFNAARQRPPNRPAPRTLLGVGRDGQPRPSPAVGSQPRASTPPPRKRPSDAPQERVTPVAGVPAVGAATAPALDSSPLGSASRTLESGQRPAQPRSPTPSPLPPSYTALERPQQQITAPPSTAAQLPWQNLHGLHADETEELGMRRSHGSRWIVAIVVLGALALVGGTVGREYLKNLAPPKPVVHQADARVPALVEQARQALAKGDFEGATAELAKASVLAEGDPRVAAEMARVEVSRVELLWAQQRLNAALDAAKAEVAQKAPVRRKRSEADSAAEMLAASRDASEKKLLEQSFQERLLKAKAAVAEAVQRAPTSLDVVRAQVDLLRLDGQLAQARSMVGALSAQASDPDNAYSLGALDLAEGPSGYAAAIDRLRVAARTEEALGRARPLLIYALTQTDPASAPAELDKLQSVAPGHRALPALRALVELAKSKVAPTEPEAPTARKPPPSSAVGAATGVSAATAPARAVPRPPPAAPRPAAQSAAEVTKNILAKATEAERQGDWDTAEGYYQAVLQRSPGNIPALSGLGDIARLRHANATAAAYYDQVLKQDRTHVPTLMSRGDMYWEAGNRILAVALYRRALGQVGSGDPVGQRALRRIEEFDRDVQAADSKANESPAPIVTEPPSPEPSPSSPSPSSPPSGTAPTDKPSDGAPTPPPSGGSVAPPASPPKAAPPGHEAPGADAPAAPGAGGDSAGAPAEKP
jgi:predicted Zn finger-like uncharacterized protein